MASKTSFTSLILGIISMFLFFVPLIGQVISILAIVLGVKNLKKNKEGQNLQKWGIGLGILSLTVALGFFWWLESLHSNKENIETEEPTKPFTEQYSACDFLPHEDDIPTEFLTGDATQGKNNCSQTYRQSNPYGVSAKTTLLIFDNKNQSQHIFTQLINEEKAVRGYTALLDSDTSYALRREGTIDSKFKSIYNLGHIVLVITISESGWFDTSELNNAILDSIQKEIENKVG